MLEVTSSAVENLKSYLDQNNIESAVRISLMQGGWAGPSLGLALDEPKDNDTTFEEDGVHFLVEQGLLTTCGTIKVDFLDAGHRSGFSITAANPIGGSGGCSSGSCGTGGCGGWFRTDCVFRPLSFWQGLFLCPFFVSSPKSRVKYATTLPCILILLIRNFQKNKIPWDTVPTVGAGPYLYSARNER